MSTILNVDEFLESFNNELYFDEAFTDFELSIIKKAIVVYHQQFSLQGQKGLVEFVNWILKEGYKKGSGIIYENAEKAIKEYYESNPAQNEWIAVEDGLPENEKFVLIFISHRNVILIGRIFENKWQAFFKEGLNDVLPLDPTHWQPLPEKPKT